MLVYVVCLAGRPDSHVMLYELVCVCVCVSACSVENHYDKAADLVWIAGQSESYL